MRVRYNGVNDPAISLKNDPFRDRFAAICSYLGLILAWFVERFTNMKYFFVSASLLILFAFDAPAQTKFVPPSGWQVVSGCGVNIYVPPKTELKEKHFSDNCYRLYESENILIEINTTPFNVSPGSYSKLIDYCLQKTVVNGREAEIITSYKPKTSEKDKDESNGFDFMTMLLVPDFRKGDDLMIRTFSKTSEERNKAIKIFESLQVDEK